MPTPGKFGRLAPLPRDEAPRLDVGNYVDFDYRISNLPKPTARVNWTVDTWPMYLNDQLGDCTEACKGHVMQALSYYGTGKEITVTDQQVLSWYERDGGYVPGDPSTDRGCVIQTVLQNWQQHDSAVMPLTAFGELRDFYKINVLKEALYLFGSVYLGVYVPASMMDQFNSGKPFTYVPGSPIEGGHAIPVQEVREPGIDNMIDVVTWGHLWPMDREFFWHYCEEAWVVVSPDWFNSSGVNPDGFDLAALKKDFDAMT